MRISGRIITVGLCPSWDVVYQFEGIDWGQHKTVSSCVNRPAGKALNISRALAWMGQTNTAAGLWGRDDYGQMLEAASALLKRVTVKLTAVDGGTRRNVTVVDTTNAREMIESLTLTYNKGRQASITKELIEVVSGVEALKG